MTPTRRKLPKWKIAAYSTALLLGIGSIAVYRFLNPPDSPDKDPDNSSFNLTKTVIEAGMRDMDKAFLSPDASTVLIDRGRQNPDASETRWLEVRDVASFRTLATIPLATLPATPLKMESVSPAVHFCNGGKSILVYEGAYTFSIIDARAYTQKASITVPVTTYRSAESPLYVDKPAVVLASSCAANAPVAAVELLFGPFGTGVTEAFDLDTGKQIAEIGADVAFGSLMNIDISPAGASAAILVERFQAGVLKSTYEALPHHYDLVILDLKTRTVRSRIRSDMDGSHVAFVGEDEVAVAGGGEADTPEKTSGSAQKKPGREVPNIELFDIHTGAISHRFGDPRDGARTFVAASSDGRLLLGYTGKEWMYWERTAGYLQIAQARFTIWDRHTGKMMAQSPGLQVFTTDYKMLDNSHTISWRPTLDFSQQGNAVLVSWPGFSTKRLEVFTMK
jgi:hypothetical protein